MSLAPESRTLLTDALRPPAGFRLDVAAATTYSVDLVALLMAPLSFAVQDHADDLDDVDPIAVMESVRRYAERLTVFCQGGGIYPTPYRTVLTFIEESVVEVSAPRTGAIFHPKVWAMRFTSGDGGTRHRVVVLSRNLTFDQSWDTIVVLDEATESAAGNRIDGAPVGRFIADLPELANHDMAAGRGAVIRDLATTIGSAAFHVPEPYRAGTILPLGLSWSSPLALEPSRRLLAISPFLSARTLADLAASTGQLTLLSRPSSLDGLRLPGSVRPYVLEEAAEKEPDVLTAVPDDEVHPADGSVAVGARGTSPSPGIPPASETSPPPVGLHAKAYLAERGAEAELVTGSANATGAGFDGNVEVVVRLTGARTAVGIDTMWEGTKEAPGLSHLVTPYEPQPADPESQVAACRAWTIDAWHGELSRSDLVLEVGEVDDGATGLTLHAPLTQPPEECRTTVRPLSLHEAVEARPLEPVNEWKPVSLTNVTPFIVVTTTAGAGAAVVRRSCVLKTMLVGDPPDRRRSALRDVLRSSEDLLRYLVFLLGDPAGSTGVTIATSLQYRWGASSSHGTWDKVAIFEPLVRAVARGDESVDRIAALLAELEIDPERDDLLPPELAALWAVIDEARQKETR